MVNKLLVVTGLIAFVFVLAAGLAQFAYAQETTCTLTEYECTIEREGDEIHVTVHIPEPDVRVHLHGACVGASTFSEDGGDVTARAICPAGTPTVRVDISAIYGEERNVATGRAIA